MSVALICCGYTWAQQSEFEVASIKQTARPREAGRPDLSFVGTSGKPVAIAGNRVTVTATLRVLIAAAYDIKDYQILSAPPWAGTMVYAVNAKTPGDKVFTQEQIRPMLQALLADRFQMKVHGDRKELPVYYMTLAKKNVGLKPAAQDGTFGWRVTPQPGGIIQSKAIKISIGDFVQLVGASTDRPVVDRTGLTGDFDYQITFAQEDARTQGDANLAIVNAVKEQLGIKLEAAKEAVPMPVVDRVEKPSEN
jgi:uncharacterized protein (TIGR03435 family)